MCLNSLFIFPRLEISIYFLDCNCCCEVKKACFLCFLDTLVILMDSKLMWSCIKVSIFAYSLLHWFTFWLDHFSTCRLFDLSVFWLFGFLAFRLVWFSTCLIFDLFPYILLYQMNLVFLFVCRFWPKAQDSGQWTNNLGILNLLI